MENNLYSELLGQVQVTSFGFWAPDGMFAPDHIKVLCLFKLSFIRGTAMEGSEFVFLGGKDGPLAPGINPATSTAPTGPLFLSRAMGPACVTHLLCTRSWDVTALHTE